MRADQPPDDDPVIRRIASVRPHVPEDDLSPESWRARAIAERVRSAGDADPPSRLRSRWARPRGALPRVSLALAPLVAAAIVLLLAGTFSGPDGSGTQSAVAAVRGTIHALASSPGTIFVVDETYVLGLGGDRHSYTFDQVQETPAGPGAQNMLSTTDDARTVNPHPLLAGWAYINGKQEIYSPTTRTIYETSIWGPYLHRGSRPGTFFYKYAPGAPTLGSRPLALTAAQDRELLNGTGDIIGVEATGRLMFAAAPHAPLDVQIIQSQVAGHDVRYAGEKRIDGRHALEFVMTAAAARAAVGPRGERIYVDPATHLPFEEIIGVGTAHQQVIHMSLRKLPITTANERRLTLQSLYPHARVDHSQGDYLRAADGEQIYTL